MGDQLEKGTKIVCDGKGSFVQFKSSEGSIFLLRNGEVKLTKNTKEESLLNLTRGKLFHVLNNNETKQKVLVKTRHATFGIRGTKYFIDEKDEKSYLCVCEGVVRATDNRKSNDYDVKANEDLYVHAGKDVEKRDANKLMIDMGYETFKEMGYPLD